MLAEQALVRGEVLRAAQLGAIKVTVTIEKYYARERRDDLHRCERGLAAGAIRQTEGEWSQLIGMLELALRWEELIGEFTARMPTIEVPGSRAVSAC